MLDKMTLLEESAFLHILLFFTMIATVFHIIGILLTQEIIHRFNLEEKFPRLHEFFKLRAMFQKYYLVFNILLLLVLCCVGLGINALTIYCVH